MIIIIFYIITMTKLMFMLLLNIYITYISTFSSIPLKYNIKIRNSNLCMNSNNERFINIHNGLLQNISRISYEKMIETNSTIKKIYILYNYDLLLKDYDNNLYLYNNPNRTNIFYEFNCSLSFISLKYLYLIITKQFEF